MFLTYSGDLYFALLVLVYFLVLEGMFGTTIGKFLLKLRVLGKDGEQCSFSASFARSLLRFVDWLPLFYIVGAIMMLPKRQRNGDRLAGTIVSEAAQRDINPPPEPFLFH